jgi:uncharacterized protein YodC (DUF2158 family)
MNDDTIETISKPASAAMTHSNVTAGMKSVGTVIDANKDLPLYKSHKTVRALEIAGVSDGVLYFMDPKYPSQPIDRKMIERYVPVRGDFYVIYDNGDGTTYASFSPRRNFLEGYTLYDPEGEKPKASESEFKPGDVVTLAGGDCPMTVISIESDGDVNVVWLNAEARLEYAELPAHTFIPFV